MCSYCQILGVERVEFSWSCVGLEFADATLSDEMKSYGTALLVLLAVLMSACGASDAPARPPSSTDQPAITGAPAGFNADDIAFAVDTATSYGQTSDLTALVSVHSTDPDIIALAADIDAVQRPNLETVKVFLVQWQSNSDNRSSAGGAVSAGPGTVDDGLMAQLGSLSGKGFDTAWLRAMIGHQQGAGALAQTEVAKGVNVDAVATAKRLVGTYQAQIARMQQLLVNPQ
jgi:uncharacterized protein (DUF305 family)